MTADPGSEARQHFESGVAAFEAMRLNDAADEFERAYQLSPAFQVLFNIGQVNVALGRHVEAIRAFRAYLDGGGRAISASRRAEVEAALERQHEFVGTVVVRVQPDGADVLVDGVRVGRTPFIPPVLLAAGRHTALASLVGFATQVRQFEVAPRTEQDLQVTLEPLAESIAPLRPGLPGAPAPEVREAPLAPFVVSNGGSAQREVTGRRFGVSGYVAGGVGLALLTGGVILTANGATVANAARERAGRPEASGASWDEARADYDSGKLKNRLGLAAIALGTGALGLTAFLLTAKDQPAASVRLELTPGRALPSGVSLRGAW